MMDRFVTERITTPVSVLGVLLLLLCGSSVRGQDLIMLKDGTIVEGSFVLESSERVEFQRIIRGSTDSKFYPVSDIVERLMRPLPTVQKEKVVSVCGVTTDLRQPRLEGGAWSAEASVTIDSRLSLTGETQAACLLDARGVAVWSRIPASRSSLETLSAGTVPVTWGKAAGDPLREGETLKPRLSLARYDAERRCVESLTLWRMTGGVWESYRFVIDPRAYKGGTGGCYIIKGEPTPAIPVAVARAGEDYQRHLAAVAEAARIDREEAERLQRAKAEAAQAAERARIDQERKLEEARQREIQKFRDRSQQRLADLAGKPVEQFNVHADWVEFWLARGGLNQGGRSIGFTDRKVTRTDNLLYRYEGSVAASFRHSDLGVFVVTLNYRYNDKGWALVNHGVETKRVGGINEKDLNLVTGEVGRALREVPDING